MFAVMLCYVEEDAGEITQNFMLNYKCVSEINVDVLCMLYVVEKIIKKKSFKIEKVN